MIRRLTKRILSSRLGATAELLILMRVTARAFHTVMPSISLCNTEKLLSRYAQFTADETKRAVTEGRDMKRIRQSLYAETYRLGSILCKVLRVSTDEEALELLKILYRNIEISIEGQLESLTIPVCYFSRVYSPQTCAVISSLDAGIFAGLCSGGTLTFHRRITEGCAACKAVFNHNNQIENK